MTHIGGDRGPGGIEYGIPEVLTQQRVLSSVSYFWTNPQPWLIIVTKANICTAGTGLTSSRASIYGPYDGTVQLCLLANGGTGFAQQLFDLWVPVPTGASLVFQSESADFDFSIWGYAVTSSP